MLARRLLQLYAGLVLYGFSAALILLAGLGADPWDVLHQGLARRTGLGTGWWVCIVGALVLLLWIPLRQRPGLGTISNVVVIGVAVEGIGRASGRERGEVSGVAVSLKKKQQDTQSV